MILSPNQIDELLSIIERFHVIFIANQLGKDILTDKDKKILSDSGIDFNKISSHGKAEVAFHYGMLADAIKLTANKRLNYEQFKKFIASGRTIPFTQVEKFALNNVKQQMYSDIKGLGNRISKDFTNVLIEHDKGQRQKYEKIIRQESTKAILNRTGVKQLAAKIGERTKDYARDLDRIADYTLHEAYDRGKAQSLNRRLGGAAKCYKQVYPQACENCVRLYLTGAGGSPPKVFYVKDLLNNGTNIGRKVKQWKPVVGATHPYCRCELVDIPPNTEWDIQSQSFVPVRQKPVTLQRKSKAKIKITIE